MVINQEVPSVLEKYELKQDILRRISQFEIKSILRRHHLKRTVIIGLIGQRGDGKSGTGASLSLVDFMLEGMKCFSNMPISCNMVIDNSTAHKYGLHSGGTVHYASEMLDKEALLRFDPMFKNSVIFGDEINMELADARRSMSNTNLWAMNVAQELRHLEAHLIYTVLDEMFIDTRLRQNTDIFLKCEDTALSIEGLENKQKEGLNIKWIPYAMTGYLAGREKSYYATKKPLPPVYFKFGVFHGIYNDKLLQATGKPKYGVMFKKKDDKGEMEGNIEIDTSHQDSQFEEYRWLIQRVEDIRDRGMNNLSKYQLSNMLGMIIDERAAKLISNFGITWDNVTRSYVVEPFRLAEFGGVAAAAQA